MDGFSLILTLLRDNKTIWCIWIFFQNVKFFLSKIFQKLFFIYMDLFTKPKSKLNLLLALEHIILFDWIYLLHLWIKCITTDPPKVYRLSQQDIIEGRILSVTCQATPGNPNSTTFYWTKVDNPGFSQKGSILQILNVYRNSSGTYTCTAENSYNNGEWGTNSQPLDVNVQCKVWICVI